MRILLSKKSNEILFEFLKKENGCNSLKELSSKLNVPFKTLQKWKYQDLYLPERILPNNLTNLNIVDKKEDNWGSKKGGTIGGKKNNEILRKKLGEEKYSELMRQRGKKVKNTIWKRFEKEELIKMTVRGKIRKREKESKKLELKNSSFFKNNKIKLDSKEINFSFKDKNKEINLPKEMTKELAEEIGIHLGDGCLLYNKNYFSVKCNKKEEAYIKNYIIPLYKKLYNLDLKLMQLESVSGFEIYSKALCEFKNKTIKIPYGKKIEKIQVPKSILDTKNKGIYKAFIRGLFDTDGCVYINKKGYSRITITIKSKKLMNQIKKILEKMGYLPYLYKWTLDLHGPTMLKKWINEINSSNPKNIKKLKEAKASSSARIEYNLAD